jgi:hypothetical protein
VGANSKPLRHEQLTTARTLADELRHAGHLKARQQRWPALIAQALQRLDRG